MNWLEGRLTADDATDVARAVAQEPHLQATTKWLREFLRLSATTQLATPPPSIHRAPTEHFKEYARGLRGQGIIQPLRGLLTADSWQRLAPAGARHAATPAAPRQLVYSSPAADVALFIQANNENLDLIGQVFPLAAEELAAYTVQLSKDGRPLNMTPTDLVGKFSFSALKEDSYALVLTADNHEIVIDPLALSLRAES